MIACFGDSFTYGEELKTVNNAWPYLLASKMNLPVINKGIMGADNGLITRSVIELVESSLDIKTVIVGWTDCNRIELYAQRPLMTRRYKNYIGPICVNPGWSDGINFLKEYYLDWHDDTFSLIQWLSTVTMLQGYLENKGIDYYFCNAFGNQQLLQQNRSNVELSSWMEKINKDKFIGWPTQGFVEWAYGEEIGPGGHPLEKGHEKIAEKIYEHIRNK